jgi:predicted O-linked N-acetylglucosamine transferase (SPINDLY family)
MLNRALQSGIDAARIVFAPRVVPSLYMARLRLADVFLDRFPTMQERLPATLSVWDFRW